MLAYPDLACHAHAPTSDTKTDKLTPTSANCALIVSGSLIIHLHTTEYAAALALHSLTSRRRQVLKACNTKQLHVLIISTGGLGQPGTRSISALPLKDCLLSDLDLKSCYGTQLTAFSQSSLMRSRTPVEFPQFVPAQSANRPAERHVPSSSDSLPSHTAVSQRFLSCC